MFDKTAKREPLSFMGRKIIIHTFRKNNKFTKNELEGAERSVLYL